MSSTSGKKFRRTRSSPCNSSRARNLGQRPRDVEGPGGRVGREELGLLALVVGAREPGGERVGKSRATGSLDSLSDQNSVNILSEFRTICDAFSVVQSSAKQPWSFREFSSNEYAGENLVNPSIPKMEVLDACFQNCIKENVSQQYIFKTFSTFKNIQRP